MMAWEWVAPTATAVAAVSGVFFTWLTGRQGRDQVERMTHRAEETALRDRLVQDRREAYFAILRAGEVSLRRKRYEREGKTAKLAEIEKTWPKGERVRMEMDAVIAVETFGSPQARELLRQWAHAITDEDEQLVRAARNAMLELTRRELGAQLSDRYLLSDR
jgi:hypothetical protein